MRWVHGSSPRVRGTLPRDTSSPACRRFIPACAGNTRSQQESSTRNSVHPRVCGEHGKVLEIILKQTGSSPRVRGTRRHSSRASLISRFIPACAGNTPVVTSAPRAHSVHPRVCGEHAVGPPVPPTVYGSSPRVRGTRLPCLTGLAEVRFIPACAGNTLRLHRKALRWPVHPRVCGEHVAQHVAEQRSIGSSPRVRGTRLWTGLKSARRRFIPACAGNTS